MKVYAFGLTGKELMPTTPRKARILLKSNKAETYCPNPIKNQTALKIGSSMQLLDMGVDTGEQHIGIEVTRENKVLHKADVELRKIHGEADANGDLAGIPPGPPLL